MLLQNIICIINIVLFIYIIYLIYTTKHIKESFINHTNRKCFSRKMSQNEVERYRELLKITFNILNKHNIDWIPISGNLLSIYRHKTLFIKWDDDYDIVINNKQVNKELEILKYELPKYGVSLSYHRKYKDGQLYKVSFTKESNKFITKYNKYTWPFIDIFVNLSPDDNPTTAHNLMENEYPLLKKNIEGIDVNIPSNGPRSYNIFNKEGFIETCKEQDWIHSLEKSIPCNGEKEVKCSTLEN